MKLRKIYESILAEIGDSGQVPSGASFSVGEHGGNIQFKFLEDNYKVEVRVLVSSENKIALAIDFYTTDESKRFKPDDYKMTNKGQPLKVMSFVVGSIEEWVRRYKSKVLKNDILELNYIKFDPKSEADEEAGVGNKRDRLYRMFIEKFAKKYNSNVTFSTVGGVTAIFRPMLEIK